ncbi:MAG: tetratricopeptide repeat protein [Betaproteobacteria bacterium]
MADSGLLERGQAALSAGNFVEATAAFEEFLQHDPDDALCWFLLGAAHHKMLKLCEAREAFLKAIALDSQHLQSRFALAAVCLDLGDAPTACTICLETTELFPESHEAWFSLGVSCEAKGEDVAALDAYGRALKLVPDHPGAFKNRRALLMAKGCVDEAVKLSRSVVSRLPYSLEAQFNLGESLMAAEDFTEASQVFCRAARLAPGDARVALHYAFALAQLERFAEAQTQLNHAANLAPGLVQDYRQSIFWQEHGDAALAAPRLDARALFLLRHFERIERCDWKERDHFVGRFSELINEKSGSALTERALGFRALAMGVAPDLQLKLARQIASGVETLLVNTVQTPFYTASGAGSSRIRLGYLSADFRYHPVALLLGDLFSWHDRSRFEVTAYSIGASDESEQRRKIIASCDEFVDLAGMDDDAAARRIAADSIDVLVDMVGYLEQSRPGILARRPAPVQVAWMGYLATTGSSWIDYVVADDVSLPFEMDVHFTETVIRLSGGLWPGTYTNRTLVAKGNREEQGLPANAIVLAAMHSHYKIDPGVFAVWMRLLSENERAVLWLLDGPSEAKGALRASALLHGVDAERLIFAPKVHHDEHLKRLQLADLALDTPQCNGGTTTSDALAACVPVLTCVGMAFMQRVAASLLHAAGQDELITYNLAQYESLAQELLSDLDRLRALARQIETVQFRDSLSHPAKWLRNFETGIMRAWENHCAGMPPKAIEVK